MLNFYLSAVDDLLLQFRLPSFLSSDASEQCEILYALEVGPLQLVQSVDGAHSEIELLKEHRARLIADAGIHEFDVRQAAVSLPCELGEDEPTLDQGDEQQDEDSCGIDEEGDE